MTPEIEVKAVAQVRTKALGSAPSNAPTSTTKEGENYLKKNHNTPTPTGGKSVTDTH